MERLDDIKKQRVINNAVELGLADRKKTSNWKRNLAVAVALIIIGIPTFGYTFPALAQHIPIIGGIFARLEDLSSLSEYATIIDETQTVDDVAFTLNEAIFDGRNIILTYFVESQQMLRNLDFEVAMSYFSREAYSFQSTFALFADDVEIPTGLSGIYLGEPTLHWVDDYRFFFVFHIPLLRGDSPRLAGIIENADKIEIFTRFTNLSITYPNPDAEFPLAELDDLWMTDIFAAGPWEFRTPLEQSERTSIYVGQRFYQYDFDRADIYGWRNSLMGGVNSLSITPTRLVIDYFQSSALHQLIIEKGATSIMRYDWQDNSYITSIVLVDWYLTDDLGTTFAEVTRRGQYDTGDFARGTIYFDTTDMKGSQVIITPVISEWRANMRWDSDTQSNVVYKGAFLGSVELEAIVVDLP